MSDEINFNQLLDYDFRAKCPDCNKEERECWEFGSCPHCKTVYCPDCMIDHVPECDHPE